MYVLQKEPPETYKSVDSSERNTEKGTVSKGMIEEM